MVEVMIASHSELRQHDILREQQLRRFATNALEAALVESVISRTARIAEEHDGGGDEDGGKGRPAIFRVFQARPSPSRGNQTEQVDGSAEQEGAQVALRALFLSSIRHASERVISRPERSRPAAAWQRHMPHG